MGIYVSTCKVMLHLLISLKVYGLSSQPSQLRRYTLEEDMQSTFYTQITLFSAIPIHITLHVCNDDIKPTSKPVNSGEFK